MSKAKLGVLLLLFLFTSAGCFPYLFLPRKKKDEDKAVQVNQPTYGEYMQALERENKRIGKMPSDFAGPIEEMPEEYARLEIGEFLAHAMGKAPGQADGMDPLLNSLAFHSSTEDKLCFRLYSGSDKKHDDTPNAVQERWETGRPWLVYAVSDLAELAASPTWPAAEGATRFDEITLEKEHKENYEDDNGVVKVRRSRFYLACAPRPKTLGNATAVIVQMHNLTVAENEHFGYDWVKSDPKKIEEERMKSDDLFLWQIVK